MKEKIALQLYTLRESCEKDFIGTLEAVAELGYRGIEFAGYYDMPAAELKIHLDRLKLTAVSSHTPLEVLEHKLDEAIAYNKAIGNMNIVCPWSNWQTEEEFDYIVQVLKVAARIIKKAGMNLYYHNHAHEFVEMNGKYALDILFEETKDEGMLMELDTYWVTMAGLDPVAYMEANADRCKLFHLKDMVEEDGKKVPAAIGEGTMPIKGILEKAAQLEIPWIIVENDFPKPNGIDNIAKSMVYLKSIL